MQSPNPPSLSREKMLSYVRVFVHARKFFQHQILNVRPDASHALDGGVDLGAFIFQLVVEFVSVAVPVHQKVAAVFEAEGRLHYPVGELSPARPELHKGRVLLEG